MSKIKTVKAAPGARRLIESLRALGYDTNTAVADLIDNSINADASEVSIDIKGRDGARPAYFVIADNGEGMSFDDLKNAMRFGSYQEYGVEDLGKYGLGLKTASLSQCGLLTVVSKPRLKSGSRSRLSIAQWDISHINKTDEWDLKTPDLEEMPSWTQQILNEYLNDEGGTVVIWSQLGDALPLLEESDLRKSENELVKIHSETSEHLRMVFHRFMQGRISGFRKLNISVCGQPLDAWDPFCTEEKKTKELTPAKMDLSVSGGAAKGSKQKIIVQPYVLPRQDEFSSRDAFNEASGPKSWNNQQGFYFYRNNRLIQAGGWSNIRSVDEHSKLLRIAVDFNATVDDSFAINITKMKARVPSELRDEFKNGVTRWNKIATERYRTKGGSKKTSSSSARPTNTPSAKAQAANQPRNSAITVGGISLVPSNAPTKDLSISKGNKPNQFKIFVPERHALARIFEVAGKDVELKQMCSILVGLIESIIALELNPDVIPLDTIKRQLGKIL